MDKGHIIPTAITLVTLAIALFVGAQVYGAITSGEMQTYAENADEWCEQEGGELYNAQSVAHGGLHCDLPNGELVHMTEIASIGWTHDWQTIRNTPGALHSNLPWYRVITPFWPVLPIVGVVALALGLASSGYHRLSS